MLTKNDIEDFMEEAELAEQVPTATAPSQSLMLNSMRLMRLSTQAHYSMLRHMQRSMQIKV